MSTIGIVILGFGLFYFGIAAGMYIQRVIFKNSDFDGTINVFAEDDKLLYSLELNTNPELLMFKKEVTFKVEIPEPKTKVAE